MTLLEWHDSWSCYKFNFRAPYGLPLEGSPRIELSVLLSGDRTAVASGHFKLRREGYCDPHLSRWFDQIVISNIEIKDDHKRRGLGTAIIRSFARKFPNALILGENPNDEAVAWHEDHMEKEFPTRMIKIERGNETRVTPGSDVDPDELWDSFC